MVKAFKCTYLFFAFILLNVKVNSSQKNRSDCTLLNYKVNTSAVPLSGTPFKMSGKWQVGRVTRKQYEIINMLYQKSRTYFESPSTDASLKYRKQLSNKNSQQVTAVPQTPMQDSFEFVHSRANYRSSTPSYIEFYYLDESDERIKHKDSILRRSRTENQHDENKFALLRPPFFLFRVNDATCNKKFSTYNIRFETVPHLEKSNNNLKITLKNKYKQDDYTRRMFVSRTEKQNKAVMTENENLFSLLRNTRYVLTTPYDRIKFFEIYDRDTHKPHTAVDTKMNVINDYDIQNDANIHLDQVDHDTGNHNQNITRFVKKHANFNFDENRHVKTREDIKDVNNIWIPGKISRKFVTKLSRPVKWSEFPFIAVYVYEPTQVRCDSASISPHWLVVSAACLYRHRKNLETEGRSAFVAYCGDNWRVPGRIAYVNQSLVHPKFHPKEKTRKYLYNIGVIQVVNSMANTCSGWKPVSLMSHQLVASRDGSFASAIGWGLDRYDTRHSSSDLPTYPLMLYENFVYSDTCPGNADYSKAKGLNDDGVKNVYCLSLPTYTLEENDSVHGGLLLIGGKLIALYLQEERRSWGDQSAQYTGIWRLIPWLLDVAREEDVDTFVPEL